MTDADLVEKLLWKAYRKGRHTRLKQKVVEIYGLKNTYIYDEYLNAYNQIKEEIKNEKSH